MNTNRNDYIEKHFGLEGRRALVTGGSRGIGRAIALSLAAAGAEVLIHYHKSEQAAQEVASAIETTQGMAWVAGADLTDSLQVQNLFSKIGERWDSLDVLVNNAGDLVRRSSIAELSDELIDQVLRVNIHSALYTTRAAIPLLRNGTHSSVINLGSVAAHNGGANGATLYAAAKGAIHSFTRGLAKELAPQIRVNAIAPGVILTDFHRKHSQETALEATSAATPLKRLGQPEDIAAAVVFLCGKGASFITGEVLEINGGLWLA